MSSAESTPVRRTRRTIKPSLKALESIYQRSIERRSLLTNVDSSSTSEDEDFTGHGEEEKPKVLHENDGVQGKELFAFQKRKQRESLAMKVMEAQKTPAAVRSKLKSKIKEMFEDSGSEYEVSESSSESSEDDDEEEQQQVKPKVTNVKRSSRSLKTNNSKYTIDTDEYFANCSGKVKTSNNTLDKLQTPRLPQYELQKLLSNKMYSKEHANKIKDLNQEHRKQFEKWLYLLSQNFSILLYGLGSKKNVLNDFHKEHLQDELVVVINGFFPGLTIKTILDNIIQDLLGIDDNTTSSAVEQIKEELTETNTDIYLLINNIEGIKGTKAQTTLASLAAIPNVNLVATIDHINAPLIWDHSKLSKFNFTWWDITNFLIYQHETECEMSSMTQQNSALALSSLRNVFMSLTQNSKAIYLKLAKYQIENSGHYYQGMAFKDLYMTCREGFIVSSDLALRAQLSEFIDHKMIKTKRAVDDGTEYLLIPLANNLLQQFIDESN